MISNSTDASHQEGARSSPDASSRAVLIVDDDRSTHGIVKKILTPVNYSLLHAFDAKQARAMIEREPPQLILCDIEMPGEDGISLCRTLKAQPATADIPLVILTGATRSETMSDAFDAGANDYVEKPLRATELRTRCKHQIAEYQKRIEAHSTIDTLQHQNTSKTKFLGVASHDLRNPIASICGVSHFLETERFGTLNESQREMVRCIIDASENMLTLVEDLLDISKIDLDHFELTREDLPPSELVAQIEKLQKPIAEKKSITLAHVDSSQGAASSIDRRLITRCIENLVTNAIKFSPKATAITLETRADPSWVYLSVKDEGPGIPENEFDKLFKEFSRTSNMPTGGESTSGIGLYVVKRIITSHSGEITVENRPEGGAHFQIKLKRIP
ncbi:hybrid sensor histidine kinase/response regulator [Pelagicoccus mobilis]|uniref:histidine kinase n=1 Tax=Pelagicoccus mobilis TaxID=415221 RepID=A0A934RRU0_9BACT|nr:hybrid sensor histidine kinase/response regulator [Pelagicoccus mobilis]MBK1875717.1 hybrid sensor histidine kinase/response regulator [Pelagicoccus mobilis]